MMIGIKSYGIYLPKYRIKREIFAHEWKKRAMPGEKAVCSFDEDSITMAVESTCDCLDSNPQDVEALYFASTTFPYKEKLNSSVVASACDLKRGINCVDFASSMRCASIALNSAINAIKSGDSQNVLITSADSRKVQPESDLEPLLGDGAASLLIGKDGVVAEILDSFSVSAEFLDYWRREEDEFVETGDERFSRVYGYGRLVGEGIRSILKKTELKLSDFAKIILPAPDLRTPMGLAKRLGLEQNQIEKNFLAEVGNTGAPHTLMMLASSLESASPGDKILFLNYGDGIDAYVLRVTKEIKKIKRGNLKAKIENKTYIESYAQYLKFKELIEKSDGGPGASPILLYKEQKQDLRLYGSKCKNCHLIQYPIARVCVKCGERDNFEDVKLAKSGKIFTYTLDNLFPNPVKPLVMAVIDLDKGGRIYLQMTETEDVEIKVGMKVELKFRKLHEGGGIHNYYWKAIEVRS